jgi:hypothetical protein
MAPAGRGGGGAAGGGAGGEAFRLPASKLAQGIRNGAIRGGLQQSSAGGGHDSDAGGASVGGGSVGWGSVLPSSALQRQLQDADKGKSGISEYELQRLKRMQVIKHHYSPPPTPIPSDSPSSRTRTRTRPHKHDNRAALCVLFLQSNHTVLQNLGLQAANPTTGKASNSARGKGKRARAGGARSVSQGATKTMLNSVRWVLWPSCQRGERDRDVIGKYPITQKQSLSGPVSPPRMRLHYLSSSRSGIASYFHPVCRAMVRAWLHVLDLHAKLLVSPRRIWRIQTVLTRRRTRTTPSWGGGGGGRRRRRRRRTCR